MNVGRAAQRLPTLKCCLHSGQLLLCETEGVASEEHWAERKAKLLEYVRHAKSYVPQGQVDVFLHEGLIEDAIAAVEPSTTHTLVERVADAAMQSYPHWVIKVSRQQAEPIMDEGKAQYYSAAARWLAKARTA